MEASNDTKLFEHMSNQAFFSRSYVRITDRDSWLIIDRQASAAFSRALQDEDEEQINKTLLDLGPSLQRTYWDFEESFCEKWELPGDSRFTILHKDLVNHAQKYCHREFFEKFREYSWHAADYAVSIIQSTLRRPAG